MTTELLVAPLENALDFIARPTPQLRAAVGRQKETLAPKDFAGLVAAVRSAFEKYTAKLLEFKPGAARGAALHEMMDRELDAVAHHPNISCRKGCSGCCSYEVEITEDEATILKTVVQDGFPLDHARLRNQAARERKSPEWNKFGNPENRCVFLGSDGACRVYEQRPAICRKHLVVSPPSACTTEGTPIAPMQVLLADILLSAALSLEGTTYASLSKMLLAALEPNSQAGAREAMATWTAGRLPPPWRTSQSPSPVQVHTLPVSGSVRSSAGL
jgi:uncharacterized protein